MKFSNHMSSLLRRGARSCRPLERHALSSKRAATSRVTGVASSQTIRQSSSQRGLTPPSILHKNTPSRSSQLALATTTLRQDHHHRLLSSAASTVYEESTGEFPSLLIKADTIEATGAFAKTTAEFLDPDPTAVAELADALQRTSTGVVAHYYMDVELQGILTAVGHELPHRIGIADSLKMGDMAVEMAKQGATQIICLGVDFMAESVQAILSKNGFAHIPVYRADERKIGCSLAESAERDVYRAWLEREGAGEAALHVIYINTSLETKAVSSSTIPTITCTSSNVLQTILQASAQIGPSLKVLYGPDTYMGQNLQRLLQVISQRWDDNKIASDLHPEHSRATLQTLGENLVVFPSGNCIVHHMFGASVVETVQNHYNDCYVTAHLEVPGEMFEIAMWKSLTDDGVVGSTADILNFIRRKVQETADGGVALEEPTTLRFILGTEAGMVTSIVKAVRQIIGTTDASNNLQVEIIFPVASEAVAATGEDDLQLVPGVSGGEGCSTAGGCATCPFMKMNDIDAVMNILDNVEKGETDRLARHLPTDRLTGRKLNGQDATELGTEAILFMRGFMHEGKVPMDLCQRVLQGGENKNQ